MKHYHPHALLPIRANLPDRQIAYLWAIALGSNAVVLTLLFVMFGA
jgi:hypothetical protein